MSDNREPDGMHPLLMEGILLSIIGITAIIVAYLVLRPAPADGVPAPMIRPAKVVPFDPHRPEGVYAMTWGGGEWDAAFFRGGNYEARAGASVWAGYWWVENDGALWVSEAPMDDSGRPGAISRWAVKWDVDSRGRVDGAVPSGSVTRPDGSHRTTISLKRCK